MENQALFIIILLLVLGILIFLTVTYNKSELSKLDANLTGKEDVEIVRSISVGQQPDKMYRNDPANGQAFSTDSLLKSNSSYTSPWIDTHGFNAIEIYMASDVVSEHHGVHLEFTDNMEKKIVRETYEYTFGVPDVTRTFLELVAVPRLVGFRLIYYNGINPQTHFLLQTDLKTNGNTTLHNDGGALIVSDAKTEIALGNVPNHMISEQFGIVSLVNIGDVEKTVWPLASRPSVILDRKTFHTTADEIFICSTDAGDDSSHSITMTLINNEGLAQVKTIALDGTTPVSTGVIGLDCNDAFLSSVDSVLDGDVYIFLGGVAGGGGVPTDLTQTLSYIPAAYGRSTQATYRVPLDQTMIISNIYTSIGRASGGLTSATVLMRYKQIGGSWTVKRPFLTTSSNIIDKHEDILASSGSFVEFTFDHISDNGTSCNVEFEYQLISTASSTHS